MKVIGLTGGISSGKSTVSKFLEELGTVVINADEIGHEAFKPGTDLWHTVVSAFGKQIVAPDGTIDREKLGTIVFGNPEALARLNRITHPRIRDVVKARLEECQQQGASVVVLEAPLLLEADWTSLVDEVWVTTAPETTLIKRLMERSGLSKKDSLARLRSQMPDEERLKHADIVIDTDTRLDELRAKVKKLWQELKNRI